MTSSIISRVSFYPSLLYNVVMNKVTNRRWYDRIDDHVILGALPLKNIAKKLIEEENIKAVVSVNEDYELAYLTFTKQEWNQWGVEVLQISTADQIESPSPQNIRLAVDFIIDQARGGRSVYVHCKAGRARSATVVACYLMQVTNCSPESVVEMIRAKRPHIWIHDNNRESIAQFYTSLQQSSEAVTHDGDGDGDVTQRLQK